jgi:hypothetical protein
MLRHLILLLALLGLLLAPATLLADDDTPPWLDDGDDDEDDDKEAGEGDEGGTTAPAPEEPSSAAVEPAAAAATGGSAAPKAGGKVGLGFGVGSVNGFSLKFWPHRKHALVFHLGAPAILNSMAVHLSYRLTLVEWPVPGSGVTIGFNLGPNFRARFAWFTDGLFLEMAGGLAVGASVTVASAPVEIFMEVIPSFGGGVSPANTGIGFGVDGLVGARFYLGK